MRYAIMRRVSPGMGNCELTFVGRTAIDLSRADEQHRRIGQMLEAEGLTVITLPADGSLPDSTFTEDTAIILDEVAVITNPGAASRRRETAVIAELLSRFRPLRWIKGEGTGEGTIEGGDVVRIDRTLYVGIDTRTNAAGLASLASQVEPFGYAVIPVPTTNCLHLKTCATYLGDETWLTNPAWFDGANLKNFRILTVPADEPWAAKTLSLNGKVYLPAGNPRTSELLEREGYRVATIEMDELQKAEAGLTCVSLIFDA